MQITVNKSKQAKENARFSKKIVIACIIFIMLYTAIEVWLSYKVGIELSPTLTVSVYAFFGTELVSNALIRVCDKSKKEESQEDIKEEENNL